MGCESLPPIARFGRLAYPTYGEVTNYTMLGSKSHGGHTTMVVSVGATWVASKLGGLNIKECLQPRESFRAEVAVRVNCGRADPVKPGGRPEFSGKKRERAPGETPGYGAKYPRTDMQR